MAFITIKPSFQPRPFEAGSSKLDMAAQMRHEPSPGEAVMWSMLRQGQVFLGDKPVRFNRQQVIRGYIADFYAPRYRAIVEIDGDHHQATTQYDDHRDGVFRGARYSIFRVRAAIALRDPLLVLELIEQFLESTQDGWTCGGGYSSHPALLWRLADFGILTMCQHGSSRCQNQPIHVFRFGPHVPEATPCLFGVGHGIDQHFVDQCLDDCRDWSNRWLAERAVA